MFFFQRTMHGMVLSTKILCRMNQHLQGAEVARAFSRVTGWPPRYPRDNQNPFFHVYFSEELVVALEGSTLTHVLVARWGL